ncbi:uncharacterized protein LOC129579311 isoform X2 [Sitodiplosis mosellana]|uniref:uncharacterized protein LOC129579311 isoform X2 n=1 Tax=Sitodiplosis mosellana TaxID=263140 RepID=UPI0024452AE5|nr:uncharacterized protein LOC129579311 isoform X2 [Sitodiplosis mosellana]
MSLFGTRNETKMSSVSSLVSSSEDEDTDFDRESVYGQLKLPWHENYWNIKITHVVSPNEVWAVLTMNAELFIRAERFTSQSMLTPAQGVLAGGVYIVKNADVVHRVRVVKTFWFGNRMYCDCFFIDIGLFETIARDELFHCAGEYENIAPQAICFKLFGFDELYHCPHIESCFSAWLLNKQFIGCLMMSEPQYQVQLNHGIKMPKVSITPFIFYPKFTLYKPILLKRIGGSLPKPAFVLHNADDDNSNSNSTMSNAKVSHVSPTGLVYFNLDERSTNYIDTLIQQYVSENQQLTHRLRYSEAANCVVLIYDIERNMHHRAKIMGVETGLPTKYKCYYMDKGDTQSVAASNIYALNDTSILSYYPDQAVPARLHLMPTFEDNVCKRLNDILTHNNVKVQVKVIDQKGNVPTVTIFKNSMNINQLIRMELELYSDAMSATFPDSMF